MSIEKLEKLMDKICDIEAEIRNVVEENETEELKHLMHEAGMAFDNLNDRIQEIIDEIEA